MIILITYPLITAIIMSIYGKKIGKKGVEIITKINIIISIIIISKYIIKNIINKNKNIINIKEIGINIGIYNIKYNIIIERYSLMMIGLIIIISSIVIIYSIWYMEEENNKTRFIIYLLIFKVSMIILVIANNYIIMFIGWEYVGIVSFLLINYWYINNNNNKSAFKAIIINKIGDIFFIIFISLIIINNLNLNLFNLNFNHNSSLIYFLFFAAIAKSAQLFFHVWLGDAMAGPTPVSALLHAATMVTAGIYILIKYEIYEINNIIINIAVLTIILGGLAAINQYDIKKIIAYSTVSQLGYMLYSIGINNKELAIYHLLTHGFFKALLFLSAGLIIHNYYNEQDIRKLGNLIYFSPLTYLYFLFGTLSIISFPYFSGYYSKELILYQSYYNNLFVSSLLYLGVLFTIIYSYNLIYHIFFKNNFISPFSPSSPSFFLFFPLLFGSLFFGYFLYDFILSNSIWSFSSFSFLPPIFHILPSFFFFLGFLFIYFININCPYYLTSILHTLFNRRFFIDSLYNYISYFFLYFSFIYLFKFIDKGFLEFIGPIGLFKLLLSPCSSPSSLGIIFNSFLILSLFFSFFSSFFFFF